MEVIGSLAKEKTVLLISHRLANVAEADNIIVLRDGTVTEWGDHNGLMEQKGYYHELFRAQQELEKYAKEAG